MSWIFFVLTGVILVSLLSMLIKIFGFSRNRTKQDQNNFDLDQVFETNKTIWQHNIQKVIMVPRYQYQEVFNVFPYFSDYQESSSFLRTQGSPNHLQNQFLVNMHQHEGDIFQFWTTQQQKILRSFDETGLGISAELVNFFLNYYNFFLEAFRNNVILYLINQILVAEMARALNESPQTAINNSSYDAFIKMSKENFFKTYASDVEQIIETLNGDVASQYSTFYQQQRMNHNQNQSSYQQPLYQQEFDEINRAYRLLEANELTNDETIKQNYRRLAKQYHPDRNRSEEAKIKMAQINAAYDLIKKIRNL